jgi:hypothetical protein
MPEKSGMRLPSFLTFWGQQKCRASIARRRRCGHRLSDQGGLRSFPFFPVLTWIFSRLALLLGLRQLAPIGRHPRQVRLARSWLGNERLDTCRRSRLAEQRQVGIAFFKHICLSCLFLIGHRLLLPWPADHQPVVICAAKSAGECPARVAAEANDLTVTSRKSSGRSEERDLRQSENLGEDRKGRSPYCSIYIVSR